MKWLDFRTAQASLFPGLSAHKKRSLTYNDVLTVNVNDKGVLDVDTVKGCTAGMAARPGTGCYGACYAARIAAFRRFDFSVAVTRTVKTGRQRRAIERAVANAPSGFFRIGVMGDPCHAWEVTTATVEWLSEFARPVVITKHWHRASDSQLRRLAACGTALNTSISALDTPAELLHREREIERFRSLGGNSVARVVSCDFNREHPEGARMGAVQDGLLRLRPLVDNPLRVTSTYPLLVQGIIRAASVRNLVANQVTSLHDSSVYLGACGECPDLCGLKAALPRRRSLQNAFSFTERSAAHAT